MLAEMQVDGLRNVWFYKAPRGRTPRPIPIPADCEYIELIVAGGVFFDAGDGERRFGPGSLFWHLPGETTVCKSDLAAPYECLVVIFASKGRRREELPRVSLWNADEAKAFANEALRACYDPAIDKAMLRRYLHTRLLWVVMNSGAKPRAEELPMPVAKAMAFIESAGHLHLEIRQLAREAGVTPQHLHRLFKASLGSTPHKLLQERRLQMARNALLSSGSTLKAIAENCGFKSVEHFCRSFKARFKSTAAELRRSQTPEAVLEAHQTKPSGGIERSLNSKNAKRRRAVK